MVNQPGNEEPLGTDPLKGQNDKNRRGPLGRDPLGRNPLLENRDSIWKTPQSAPPSPMIMGPNRQQSQPDTHMPQKPATNVHTTFEEPPWTPVPTPVEKLDLDDETTVLSAFPKIPEDEKKKTEEMLLLLGVRFGGKDYLIDLLLTREIIRMRQITPTPRPDSAVTGAINLRGEVIPIISLRRLFDLPRAATSKENRIIIMNLPRGEIGIVADEVTEIIKVPLSSLIHPHGKTTINPAYVLGVCKTHGEYLPWIDIMKVLDEL